jgi:hypothetical protein
MFQIRAQAVYLDPTQLYILYTYISSPLVMGVHSSFSEIA